MLGPALDATSQNALYSASVKVTEDDSVRFHDGINSNLALFR